MATATTGLATSFIQFSRPSASGGGATVTLSNGKIGWAGHNLLSNSESFDAAAWVKASVAITANYAVAPNGTTTADRAVYAGGLGSADSRQVWQGISDTTANKTYTFSVWVWGTGKFRIRNTQGGVVDNYSSNITATSTPTLYTLTVTNGSSAGSSVQSGGVVAATDDSAFDLNIWGAHLYRSDLGGMQQNPAMPAGMGSYYPTTPRNLLGATEAFSDATVWGYTGLSAFGSGSVANAAVAPNGLQTADLLTAAAGTNSHSVQQQKTTVANTEVTYSVYAKYSTAQYIAFGFLSGSTGTAWAFATVDIQSGTVTQTTVGAGASTTATAAITPVGNGWHRISVKVKSNTSDTYAIAHIVNSATPSFGSFGAYSWTAAGTESVYLWGAQLSDSASLDAYSPVYGAAVTSAAYYAPRLDYDSSGVARGLLVEEARTNLLDSSISVGGWSGNASASLTPNSAASPDGSSNASLLAMINNSTSGIYRFVTVTNARTYTFSAFVKAVSGTPLLLLGCDSSPSLATVTVNAATGAVTSPGANVTGSSSVPFGSGWHRVSVSFVSTSTSIGLIAYNATGASASVYIYGSQLEEGSFSTSMIVTPASATATRAADVASVSTQAFPYSASEGTIVVSADVLTVSNPNTAMLYSVFTDGNNFVNSFIWSGAPSTPRGTVTSPSGPDQANLTAGTVSANTAFKSSFAFKANDFAFSLNGSAAATDTTGTMPNAANNLELGRQGSLNFVNGHIRQITYIPRRISNAELQSRTA